MGVKLTKGEVVMVHLNSQLYEVQGHPGNQAQDVFVKTFLD